MDIITLGMNVTLGIALLYLTFKWNDSTVLLCICYTWLCTCAIRHDVSKNSSLLYKTRNNLRILENSYLLCYFISLVAKYCLSIIHYILITVDKLCSNNQIFDIMLINSLNNKSTVCSMEMKCQDLKWQSV